ncbi:hypothetical protein [Planktotalea arctica]
MSCRITLQVTERELAAVRAKVADAGFDTVSDYIRAKIDLPKP